MELASTFLLQNVYLFLYELSNEYERAHALSDDRVLFFSSHPKFKINKCRWFIVHYATLTCNSMQPQHTLQSTFLITGIRSQPELSGVNRLIAAYIGATIA